MKFLCRIGLHRSEIIWRSMFGYSWRCVDCGKVGIEAGPQ
jgi:hypothetical protein